jgi:hypothetical protein
MSVTLIGHWVFVFILCGLTAAMGLGLLCLAVGSLVAWFLSYPNRRHAALIVLWWVVFVGSMVLAMMHEAERP